MNSPIMKRATEVALLTWLILAISLFMFANRISYLQNFSWPSLSQLYPALERIQPAFFIYTTLKALFGILIFSFACLAIGFGVMTAMRIDVEQQMVMALTAFLTGEIVFSTIFLILTSTIELTPLKTAGVILTGSIFGAKPCWNFLKRLNSPRFDLDKREKIIIFIMFVITIFGLFNTASRLSYDSVSEYFSHAKIVAQIGRPIFLYPSDYFVVSSMHPGILFSAVIQLFGDQAARMLSWSNGLVVLLTCLSLARQMGFSVRSQLYLFVLLFTTTAFVDLLGDGKIELISTAPILIAIFWLQRNYPIPKRNQSLLIGLLLGFSIISRPYNIFLVPVFTILFFIYQVWKSAQASGFTHGIRINLTFLWVLPPLLSLGLLHLWQNQVWLGSPLAPLTYAQNLHTNDWQWQVNPSSLTNLRLLYPLVVSFFNTPQSLGNISPLFIGSLPFLLIKTLRNALELPTQLKRLLILAIITLFLWIALFFTVVEIRYVYFIWVVLFLFDARIIETTQTVLEKPMWMFYQITLIFLLGFICLRSFLIFITTYSPIDKNGQAHCYDIPFCTFLDAVNQDAPIGKRILVLNAYRYYLRPDLFSCSSQMPEYIPLKPLSTQNPLEFWTEVYRQGYTYLTYEKNFAEFHSRFGTIPDPASSPEWLIVSVVSATANETAYKLQAIDPPFKPEKVCIQKNGIWQVFGTQP